MSRLVFLFFFLTLQGFWTALSALFSFFVIFMQFKSPTFSFFSYSSWAWTQKSSATLMIYEEENITSFTCCITIIEEWLYERLSLFIFSFCIFFPFLAYGLVNASTSFKNLILINVLQFVNKYYDCFSWFLILNFKFQSAEQVRRGKKRKQ